MVGEIEQGPVDKEFPGKETENFTQFVCSECFLRVSPVFLADEFVSSVGNVVNYVHEDGKGLEVHHEVDVVLDVFVVP